MKLLVLLLFIAVLALAMADPLLSKQKFLKQMKTLKDRTRRAASKSNSVIVNYNRKKFLVSCERICTKFASGKWMVNCSAVGPVYTLACLECRLVKKCAIDQVFG